GAGPLASAVRFIDLTRRLCPFPLGEPEDGAAMVCCGAPKPVGRPYCRRHMAIAYTDDVGEG
ncbi:MAG: hypothetical protein GY797_40805, partial [Deltaproteobacteria bacterium]|nr:hypothetical protein [Deltaproteobacteria bacterium]